MMRKFVYTTFSVFMLFFIVGCNDTVDENEQYESEMKEDNVNEADNMIMDHEMDEKGPDYVDEDSLNDDGINGNHKFDINEYGELNGENANNDNR